jgi:hypothetical protein
MSHEIKEDEMTLTCSTHAGDEKYIKHFIWNIWREETLKKGVLGTGVRIILKRIMLCRWGETIPLNCGHQRAYCSSLMWYMSMESHGGKILTGETEVLGEEPDPLPLCPPQITHGLTRARTLSSAMRGRRLTTWAMARSECILKNNRVRLWTGVIWLHNSTEPSGSTTSRATISLSVRPLLCGISSRGKEENESVNREEKYGVSLDLLQQRGFWKSVQARRWCARWVASFVTVYPRLTWAAYTTGLHGKADGLLEQR